MKGRVLQRSLLLLGSLAISFFVVELALRAHYQLTWRGSIEDIRDHGPVPTGGGEVQLGQMLRPSLNPRLVYGLKPGLDARFKRARVRTNSAGFREQPHPQTKPDGAIRIVGIGDSTMFGWGVAEDERYLDQLERRLNAERPAALWQTIVTAVPGYNLVMEVETLVREGRYWAPDLVVYGWNPNDLCLPDFLLPKRDFWSRVSFLAEYAAGLVAEGPRLMARKRLTDSRCQGDDLPARHRQLAGRDAFGDALSRLAAFGLETGTPIAVVADFESGFEDQMATVLPRSLHYSELADSTRSMIPEKLVLSRRDPHPNRRGHQLVADTLFEDLEAAGVWQQLLMNLPRSGGNAET